MSNKKEIKEKINRVLLIIIIIGILVSLVIIIKNKIGPINGELHCSYKNNTNTMINSFDYNLSFKHKNVTKLETKEIIESEDEELLNTYKESVEMISDKYKDLDFYDTKITQNNNKLIVETKIDYNKIDMKKYNQIEGEKSYIKNNKLNVDKMKEIYEKNGATCKYK